LERPRGPLCNRRDARDEKSLRESARLLGRVWENKRYTGGTGGPATCARKRRHHYRKQLVCRLGVTDGKGRYPDGKEFAVSCMTANLVGKDKIGKGEVCRQLSIGMTAKCLPSVK
jgi:hypothetical protein